MRILTLVCAPDIPVSEIQALEGHCRKAMTDPEYVIVVNYEVHVNTVQLYPDYITFVMSPDMSSDELDKLRGKILNPNTDLIVTTVPVYVNQTYTSSLNLIQAARNCGNAAASGKHLG